MNKILILSIVLITFISSCIRDVGTKQENTIAVKRIDVIQPINQELMDSIHFSKNNRDLLFIVDANCSICIGQFLNELTLLSEMDDMKSVVRKIVMLPTGTAKVTRYYMKQQGLFSPEEFIFFESSKEYNSLIAKYSGYFYEVNDGKFTKMWTPVNN